MTHPSVEGQPKGTEGPLDRQPVRQSSAAVTTLVAAVAVGILAALVVRSKGLAQPTFHSDFDQVWAATRALLAGRNPYAEVGPGAPFEWKWPLYYPLPALLLAVPFAHLPLLAARMAFSGVAAGLLTLGIGRDGWRRWPIFLSITFLVSVDLVQWPLLLTAMWFFPALGGFAVAKPNFVLPILLSRTRSREILVISALAVGLLLVSLIVRPSWPAQWFDHLRTAPHFRAPVQRPLGFLLLLAALKWRRPEARWLLGLALIPQAPSFYDQLLLVIVCLRWWETALLSVGTWGLFFVVGNAGPQPDYAAWGTLVGNWTVWLCYLPCLAMLLRRPNVGETPQWWPARRTPQVAA